MKKCSQFRQLLINTQTTPIMEAHNAISAIIAAEAGFKALWASGLTISASMGVRDCNELTWTQILDHLELINDSIDIPIVVDGDSGFGNFNTVRRFVKKLGTRNIAAICLEDKLFPKRNSFADVKQALEPIEEFCSKIKAGKDAQTSSDFAIIARCEALICGYNIEEALIRANAYYEAGADAILIHSKQQSAEQVFTFCNQWHHQIPVIAVPTKYYQTPFYEFEKHKLAIIIWANQSLRAAILAMKMMCAKLYDGRDLTQINSMIVPLEEIFRYVNENELMRAEKYYLPHLH